MKIPSYLTHDFRLIQGNGELTEVYFGSQSTEDTFEIWFTGEVVSVDEEAQPYIMETDSHPLIIIAKHSVSGQTFLLFDGTIHGYDAMFCDQPYDEPLEQLSPIKYDFPPAILKLSFFYNIDYEDEKESYEFDAMGNVMLLNGLSMPWEQVKCDGFDAFALSVIDTQGIEHEIVNLELA